MTLAKVFGESVRLSIFAYSEQFLAPHKNPSLHKPHSGNLKATIFQLLKLLTHIPDPVILMINYALISLSQNHNGVILLFFLNYLKMFSFFVGIKLSSKTVANCCIYRDALDSNLASNFSVFYQFMLLN